MRTPIPDKDKRISVGLSLSPAQREFARREAERQGMTLTRYVGMLIDERRNQGKKS